MIEYMYSRIITTIASAALVAIVASAALWSSEQQSIRYAENIAESISNVVADASTADAEYFEQRLSIGGEWSSRDLSVLFNSSYVEVDKGTCSVKRAFEKPVYLLFNEAHADRIEAMPGSTIVVKSSGVLFEKENNVTIEIVPPSSLTYNIS